MSTQGCGVLIVGGGIAGLTVARELVRRGAEDVLVIEKEPTLAPHASSRNSGVLHAGIYYTPETLKARFCVEGNRLMKAFCREKGLTLKETGKVIVARDESEVPRLDELERRARAAGAKARLIDEKELAEIEPHARTCGKALHSPETAVIKPKEILKALEDELTASGKARIAYGVAFAWPGDGKSVRTRSGGAIRYDKLINTAGAFADRVAQSFGLASEYRSIPFKGTYRQVVPERASLVRGSIYPVPDLRNPFLGVHLTRGADEHVYAGPTAIPAFGRENYRFFEGLGCESVSILWRDAVLFFANAGFRSAALTEPRKYSKRVIWREAQALCPELELVDLVKADKIGIRPQLVHWPERRLVGDFVVLKDRDCVHVLNAISPAFTSSMSFARHVADVLGGVKR